MTEALIEVPVDPEYLTEYQAFATTIINGRKVPLFIQLATLIRKDATTCEDETALDVDIIIFRLKKIRESVCLLAWIAKANKGNLIVHDFNITGVKWFGPNNVGFIFADATITNSAGKLLPGAMFLRADAVAVLVLLRCKKTGKIFVVFTVQARTPVGDNECEEIPAGMVDKAKKTFVGVAAAELQEETGIVITEDRLELMRVVKFSPGGCSEEIGIFRVVIDMEPEEIAALQGKLTGVLEEGEMITLKIVPYEVALDVSDDAKFLVAIALHERLVRTAAVAAEMETDA